jgi:uncharacterized protein (TIGR03437 family)
VAFGDVAAPVQYAGLAPDEANVYQVNVLVPQGAAAGDNVPVVVMVTDPSNAATAQSNTVSISLR